MADEFAFDVFLSHSSRDKAVVREIAERLRADGLRVWLDAWEIKPGDSIPAKIEHGLEVSRVLVLCMSANAFGSDWSQLEYQTFRFRDPLNKQKRFLPLRLDDAPAKGSLGQFLHIDWRGPDRELAYAELVEACAPANLETVAQQRPMPAPLAERSQSLDDMAAQWTAAISPDGAYVLADAGEKFGLWQVASGCCLRMFEGHSNTINCIACSSDGLHALSAADDMTVRLWDIESGRCLGVFKGHSSLIWSVAWSNDGIRALSGSSDKTMRLWDVASGHCLRVFRGHSGPVVSVAWNNDGLRALSGSDDNTMRLWDVDNGDCLREFTGHTGLVGSVAWRSDGLRVLSGSTDNTLRLWDVESGRCVRVFEGHSNAVNSVAWSRHGLHALSGSDDSTVRLWDVESGRCLRVCEGHSTSVYSVAFSPDGCRGFSVDCDGGWWEWDLTDLFADQAAPDQIQYTNAKVLLVGDTHAGKTGLTYRLATGKWKPSEESTVGAWSTQWKITDGNAEPGVEREIWLWDFGGQADQRLIHQLYMDRAALILLLFNADQDDVLPGLRDWQTALRRCAEDEVPQFLVAGRIDTGFKASRGKLQAFAAEQGLDYHETSAKTGEGCAALRASLIRRIPWKEMTKRTSPRIFKLIKDEILKLRDEGQVLHTFKELRELLWRRLPDEPRFSDDILQTVIGLLDGPGVVKELDYGTYVLLAPEWINAYAQAVIRTLRSAENELGVLPLRSIAEGNLIYQSIGRDGAAAEMKRLPPAEERVVLGEMERQLEQRGLCRRQGDKLVFPSHCGRDRPAVQEHPSVFVSYKVTGFLDDIYATLVVKLADSEAFRLDQLWRDAADFATLAGDHHMGLKLTRETASDGEISVYFGKGVTEQEQVIFANYIETHLAGTCETAQRLRHYVCPQCHTPKGNPQVLMDKLIANGEQADTECDKCGQRFPLWDTLENKFASAELRQRVQELQAVDAEQLDTRRQAKLLVLEVSARITSADQKCFPVLSLENEGLDLELEFTDDEGQGSGRRLYLQLKAGNSHLRRQKDGGEIFPIEDQWWVTYWLQQPYPVMLVIGTFAEDRGGGREKREFADVRWMEISSVLKRESHNGSKPVKQIEFHGQRLDMTSVRQWRDRMLGNALP